MRPSFEARSWSRPGLVAASLLTVLASCHCPVEPAIQADPASRLAGILPTVYLVGEEITLLIPLSDRCLSTDCAGGTDARLDAEVYDPDNRLVPLTLSSEGGGVRVRFTGSLPGNYFGIARELPNGLVVQFEALVAADRTDVSPVALGRRCSRLGRTRSGSFVCDSQVLSGSNEVTLPDAVLHVAGDSIWSGESPLLRRWNDDGSAVLSETLETLNAGAFDQVAFAERSALLVGGESIRWKRLVGGKWTETSGRFPAEVTHYSLTFVGEVPVVIATFGRDGSETSLPCVLTTSEGGDDFSLPECWSRSEQLWNWTDQGLWTITFEDRMNVDWLEAGKLISKMIPRDGGWAPVATLRIPETLLFYLPGAAYMGFDPLEGFTIIREKNGRLTAERYDLKGIREITERGIWSEDDEGNSLYTPFD